MLNIRYGALCCICFLAVWWWDRSFLLTYCLPNRNVSQSLPSYTWVFLSKSLPENSTVPGKVTTLPDCLLTCSDKISPGFSAVGLLKVGGSVTLTC